MMKPFLYSIIALPLIALVILVAATPNLIEMGYHTDKMLHLFIFTIATVILALRCQNKARLALSLIGLCLLGGGIELIQSLSPTRQAEWQDLLANSCGLPLGLLIAYLLRSGYTAGG